MVFDVELFRPRDIYFGSLISGAGCVREECKVAPELLSFCFYFASWFAFRLPVIAVHVYILDLFLVRLSRPVFDGTG